MGSRFALLHDGYWASPQMDLFASAPQPLCSETWPASGTMRAGVCYRHPDAEHHTAGAGSSYSRNMYPTLAATPYGSSQNGINGKGGKRERPSASTPSPETKNWPTPRATDGPKGGPNGRDSSGSPHLTAAAARWPTPTTRDAASAARHTTTTGIMHIGTTRTDAIRMWSTPTASDTTGPGRNGEGGANLRTQVSLWPTPMASSNENRTTRHAPTHGVSRGRTLAGEAAAWPTPAARDYKAANGEAHLEAGTGRKHLDQLPNFVRFLPGPPSTTSGPPSSDSTPNCPPPSPSRSDVRKVLNPNFVDWLMGLPIGWSDCESTVTPSFPSWQREHLLLLLSL